MGAALLDLELEQPAQALVILDRVISMKQRLNEAHLYRGIALSRLGDRSGALESFKQVGPSTNLTTALREASALLVDERSTQAINAFFEAHREAYPDAREINFIFHAESLTSIDAAQAIDVLSQGVRQCPIQRACSTHEPIYWRELGALMPQRVTTAVFLNSLPEMQVPSMHLAMH